MELNNLNGEHTKRSRKRSSLVGNYSKFAIPDSLISDRLINSFSEREREKEKSDQAFSICMKFHFRFPGSFHRAPPRLTRLSQFALACYWAVVYFGLIITSGANDSSMVGNREQRRAGNRDRGKTRKV